MICHLDPQLVVAVGGITDLEGQSAAHAGGIRIAIQDAESTIRDTDVAEEMMSYVKNNILVQSAQPLSTINAAATMATAIITAAAMMMTALLDDAGVRLVSAGVSIVVPPDDENSYSDDGIIGYATEAKVMLDQDSLQAAMDEAMANARDGNVGLMYKNDAFSDDGVNFLHVLYESFLLV